MNPIDRDALNIGERLGSGGQGVVYRILNRKINSRWDVAYKEYNPSIQEELDFEALRAMVELIPTLAGSTAEWLCNVAAWPAALVERNGRVSGFLMRTIPEEYHFDYTAFDGTVARKPATTEFLLNDDSYTSSIGLYVNERMRLLLLTDLARMLSHLHELGIAVGDMSPKNLLFAAGDRPSCFLIDCDAMRLNGRTVLPQAETPGWQIPPGEERGTPSSDAYKLALLAVRMFARDQSSRDVDPLSTAAEPKLVELARTALLGPQDDRPMPAEWTEHLLKAARSPNLAITPRADITSANPKPDTTNTTSASGWKGLPRQVKQLGNVAITVGILAILVVALVIPHHGHPQGQAGQSPNPAPSPSSPSPEPTTEQPSTPPSDPNSADTDQTPFTADALLATEFTTSDGQHFTRKGAGPASCITSDQNDAVTNILTQYDCRRQINGTYTNDARTILVSVEVMPMTDESTAQQIVDAVKSEVHAGNVHAGDFGFWCPHSGIGSSVCHRDSSAATKLGAFNHSYRYFVNADAIWINLSDDTSSKFERQLTAAANAAVDEAGPDNYSGNP